MGATPAKSGTGFLLSFFSSNLFQFINFVYYFTSWLGRTLPIVIRIKPAGRAWMLGAIKLYPSKL